jgi:hypothetical protein
VLHEAMSEELQDFLPWECWLSDDSYYTSCFLVPYSNTPDEPSSRGVLATGHNRTFLKDTNHLAFHHVIDFSYLDASRDV